MKKIFKYLFAIILLLISTIKVEAMSVSKNDITIEKGTKDSVELYATVEQNVTSIEFVLTFTTYDIPAYFIVNSNFVDTNPNGIKHIIQFTEVQTGKILLGTVNISPKSNPTDTLGTVNINSGKATTENGEVINLNKQDINVKIGVPIENNNDNNIQEETVENKNNIKEEKDKETDKQEVNNNETKKEAGYNLLTKIESKLVNIEIKENVFEYTVTIDKETLELDLNPVAINDSSKIDITTQKIEELKDNKILITVKNGEEEQIYTVNVNVLKDFEKAEIDNSKFEANNSYKGKWLIVTIVLIICLIGSLLLTKKR